MFTTTFTLLVDAGVARRGWRQAIAFPGLVSLTVMAWVLVPRPMHDLVRALTGDVGLGWSPTTRSYLALAAYVWVSVCIVFAWAVYRLDKAHDLGSFGGVLVFLVGYGPLLCAVTLRRLRRRGARGGGHMGQDREDREGGHGPMSSSRSEHDDPIEELEHDRRMERRLLWKGLLALLVVVLVAWLRQHYFV